MYIYVHYIHIIYMCVYTNIHIYIYICSNIIYIYVHYTYITYIYIYIHYIVYMLYIYTHYIYYTQSIYIYIYVMFIHNIYKCIIHHKHIYYHISRVVDGIPVWRGLNLPDRLVAFGFWPKLDEVHRLHHWGLLGDGFGGYFYACISIYPDI